LKFRRFFGFGSFVAAAAAVFFLIFFFVWHEAYRLFGANASWAVLGLWLVGSFILTYLPQIAVLGGRYSRENIVQAYFASGFLLIFFGALSAGYAMQIGAAQTISDDTVELIQIAMLACTATVGGAFCADAILGMEFDNETRRMDAKPACVIAAIFAVATAVVAMMIAGRPSLILEPMTTVMPFVFVVCFLVPWIAVLVASVKFKLENMRRRPFLLMLVGAMAIASAICGVVVMPPVMQAANWAPGSIEFLKQVFLATGAGIGGALIARAMETNVHRFDFERWANGVVASAFGGAKAEVKDGIITVRHADSSMQSEQIITLTIAKRLLLKLMIVSEVSRKEIAELASDYLTNQYAGDTRNAINYKLKADLLKKFDRDGISTGRRQKT